MAGLPVKYLEVLQLKSLGISEGSIAFSTLTMESEKYICVREESGGKNEVAIIDVASGTVDRRPIKADSAIMNPSSKIIALKAGKTLQIFDLEKKQKIKSCNLTNDVEFWKWLDNTTLGLVTQTEVYHWSLDDDKEPNLVFKRDASLNGCQIINYRANANKTWVLLMGIAPRDGRVAGFMQLYSTERKVCRHCL